MFARMRFVSAFFTAAAVIMSSGCQLPNQQDGRTEEQASAGRDLSANELSIEGPLAKIEARTYLAAARLHESQKRFVPALQQYQYALVEDPRNVQIMVRMGVLYDQLGNGAMAERAYQEALRIEPDNAQVHNNLGFSYVLRQQWEAAEIELVRALELAPGFGRARINLGMVLGQQGRFDDALQQFQMVLPLEEAYYNQGLMYQSKRKTVEAAQAYKQALEANPKLAAAAEQLKRMPADVLGAADRKMQEEREAAARLAQSSLEPTLEPLDVPATRPAAELDAVSAAPGMPGAWLDDFIKGMLADAPAWVVTLQDLATNMAVTETTPAAQLPAQTEGETATKTEPQAEFQVAGYQPIVLFSLTPSIVADLDSLFPSWQQSPDLILDLREDPSVLLVSEDCDDWFAWQASPAAAFVPDPETSTNGFPVAESTQPD